LVLWIATCAAAAGSLVSNPEHSIPQLEHIGLHAIGALNVRDLAESDLCKSLAHICKSKSHIVMCFLSAAGMACKTPQGERILPKVTQADAESLAKRAADQQALIDSLLTGMQLQGYATQRQGAAANGVVQQEIHPGIAVQPTHASKAQQQQQLQSVHGHHAVHSQQGDPQRPAAIGQTLTGNSLTGNGLTGNGVTSHGAGGGVMRGVYDGQSLDMAALQQAVEAALQQQALKHLKPGLAAVSGTQQAALA
jgi:hypothetical protein